MQPMNSTQECIDLAVGSYKRRVQAALKKFAFYDNQNRQIRLSAWCVHLDPILHELFRDIELEEQGIHEKETEKDIKA